MDKWLGEQMDREDFMSIHMNWKFLWFGTCLTISQGPLCHFLSTPAFFLPDLLIHLPDHQMLQQELVQTNKNSQ